MSSVTFVRISKTSLRILRTALTDNFVSMSSETMARITRHHPVDTTLPVESVQASLILGDVPRVSSEIDLLNLFRY